MGQVSEKAIEIASSYLGDKETKPNDAPWLEDLMDHAGNPLHWVPGESYCIGALSACFAEALEAVNVTTGMAFKYPFPFSLSTQGFYAGATNCNKPTEKEIWTINGYPDPFGTQPYERGDIVIFRLGQTWEGHAELVISASPEGLTTIGFNTGEPGANQREGTGVYEKTRLFSAFAKPRQDKALWMRGAVKMSKL